jgi:hypothetical protein
VSSAELSRKRAPHASHRGVPSPRTPSPPTISPRLLLPPASPPPSPSPILPALSQIPSRQTPPCLQKWSPVLPLHRAHGGRQLRLAARRAKLNRLRAHRLAPSSTRTAVLHVRQLFVEISAHTARLDEQAAERTSPSARAAAGEVAGRLLESSLRAPRDWRSCAGEARRAGRAHRGWRSSPEKRAAAVDFDAGGVCALDGGPDCFLCI